MQAQLIGMKDELVKAQKELRKSQREAKKYRELYEVLRDEKFVTNSQKSKQNMTSWSFLPCLRTRTNPMMGSLKLNLYTINIY